ncbi:MAG: helix-turn-helix domain-containing protein [Alphaproteobacteria bacterium]
MPGKRTFTLSPGRSDRERARSLFNRPAPEPADAPAAHEAPGAVGPSAPIDPLLQHATLGQALKAAREERGLTLQQIADDTRVRRVYLEAIEEMRLDALPSRPFAIGYIRAFATSLGLDPDLAVERFKTDDPVLDQPLQAPVGVLDERDPRVAAFLIGGLVIVAAIVLWNVAQRAMVASAPPSSLTPEAATAKALGSVKTGVVQLGTPLPAPVESTTPPAYETPGLAAAMGLKVESAAAGPAPATSETSTMDLTTLPPVFAPQGKVYDSGAPGQASIITVQALKPASLILRGADGSVYFARQLAKGEAFRVPQVAGLTLDVSKADDIQVFVYGRSTGVLPAQQVLASKLATPPPLVAPPRAVVAKPPIP